MSKIARKDLETGMIVHMSGRGLMCRFLRRLFGSKYIHSGIIWVISGVPFIVEVTGGRKRKGFKSGWDVVSLDAYAGKRPKRWVSCVQEIRDITDAKRKHLEFIFAKTLDAHKNTTRKDDIRYGYTKALSVVFKNIRGGRSWPVCSDYVREMAHTVSVLQIRPDLEEMILPPQLQSSSIMFFRADGIE